MALRAVIAAAGLYNLAFGLWTVLFPGAFFSIFELEPPRYPEIWSCLGMVVGIYGAGYLYASAKPDRGRAIVAIGLAGKILGPIGWLASDLPLRTLPLIVLNDILWWVPFALFLFELPRLRAAAPWVCAGLNVAGAFLMLFALRQGTEAVDDPVVRALYISKHPWLWRGGWTVWIAAAISLTGFFGWWGARVGLSTVAVMIAGTGNLFDLTAEALWIGWLPADIETVGPLGSMLSGGIANALYCVSGLILTWATPMPLWLRAWSGTIWIAGFGLTFSVIAGSVAGMIVTTAVTMTLFCPWVAFMGRRLQ